MSSIDKNGGVGKTDINWDNGIYGNSLESVEI